MQYNSHIKSGHLKTLIQQKIPCEDKLSQIAQLLGLPSDFGSNQDGVGPPNLGGGEANSIDESVSSAQVEQQAQVERRNRSFERILANLTVKNKRIALSLLRRIESSEGVGWDYDTGEIIVGNERLPHSSIKKLVEKVVIAASPQLPIGLVRFVNGLIDSKIPLQYMLNSDVLNIREGLLAIKRGRQEQQQSQQADQSTVEQISEEAGGEEGSIADPISESEPNDLDVGEGSGLSNQIIVDEPAQLGSELNEATRASSGEKRAREVDSEDDNQESGRLKTAKLEHSKGKSKAGAKGKKKSATTSAPVRRSSRLALRSDLTENWSSVART